MTELTANTRRHLECDMGRAAYAPSAKMKSVETSLVADGRTIVDSSPDMVGPLVDARRGGYALEVDDDPNASRDYYPTGASMSASVRKGQYVSQTYSIR